MQTNIGHSKLVSPKAVKRARRVVRVSPGLMNYWKREAARMDRRARRIAVRLGHDYEPIRVNERDIY